MKSFKQGFTCDPCVKCGYQYNDVKYVPPSPIQHMPDGVIIEYPEYLQITCKRCGYKWEMRTKDAE